MHGHGPRPLRRRGFILAVVIALSIIIGMLVFAYYQGFRHRDAQVRLSSDRAAARWLARACVDALKYAFHEAPDPRDLAQPNVENGSLLPFLLGDSASLKARFDKRIAGKKDHREFIEQLVGKERLQPIENLTAKLPDAKVTLFLDLRPSPMWRGDMNKTLSDPAFKVVDATYRVVARVRKAQEIYRATDVIDVHSLLPPAVSKFTFAVTGDAGSVNSHKVNVRGEDAGGTAPVVLMHHPDDGDPVAQDPFQSRPTGQKPLTSGVTTPDQLLKATADRGMVYLPGTPETPVVLQLASGGSPFGEYHTVYQPAGGKIGFPSAVNLPQQPAKAKAFRAPSPLDPTVHQVCAVQGAVFGFFDGIDQHQVLGTPPPGAVPEMCSQLKPFGTGTHPSSGAIVGHVNRAMGALSDIAIDRDDTGRDEADQQAAVGKPLPIRDGIDPFLRACSQSEYEADVAREGGGARVYARLLPFGMLGQNNGFIPNENALADLDGDGRRETPVSSEALHNPFRIDPVRWKYSALFEKYEEYQQVMSKYLMFPANLSLQLGTLPVDRAREVLLEVGFGKNAATFRDWMLEELRLEPRDQLHAQLAQRGASKYYLDTKETGMAGLGEAISTGARVRYPTEITYLVKGQAKFEEVFMPGGQIDLQGLKVMVVREKPEDKPPLEFAGEVVVKPGSGGTLIVDRFKAKALKNPGTAEGYAPFVLQAGELVMTSKGPFEGVIVPGNIVQESVTDYTVIRGTLAVGGMPSSLSNPLVVAYDPRNDPTAAGATMYYRAQFRRDTRQYDVEDRP